MKKYIFSLVCLCCTLLPALEGQAHEYPNHPELRKSDANIVGHILDKNTKEHLPYITVALKGTTIGTVTDATGHYFLKNLPEGNFVLEVSSVGYKTVRRNVTLKKGRTLEEDFLTGLHFELVNTVVNYFFQEDIDSVFGMCTVAQPSDIHTGACAYMFHVT